MKKYIFLVILLCFPTLTLKAAPTSSVPISSSTTTTTFCYDHDECEDYNPCTADSCISYECSFKNVIAPCDDGIY